MIAYSVLIPVSGIFCSLAALPFFDHKVAGSNQIKFIHLFFFVHVFSIRPMPKQTPGPKPPSKLSRLLPSSPNPPRYFTSRLPAPPRLSHLKARMITSTYQNAHQARHGPSKQGSAKLDLLIGRNDSLLPHKANLPTLAPAFDNSVSGSTSALQTFLSEHHGVAD